MTVVHSISLKGFWSKIENGYRRNFGAPRMADPRESIWLVVQGQPTHIEINGVSVPFQARTDFVALPLPALSPRNTLDVSIDREPIAVIEIRREE